MEFARVNGVALHYQTSGAHALPALVFVNSLGTDFRIWDAVADHFRDRYRILTYDKRGHGLSQETPAPGAMTDHVDDLVALLDHCGIDRAVVVGLSIGGMIAQGLAALHPERVSALVLCDTAPKIGTDESWNTRIEAVRRDGIGSLAEMILNGWFTAAFRRPDNALFDGCRAMLTRQPVEGYVASCAAVRDCDLTEATRALKLPVLCLVGADDASTPPDLVRAMAEMITGAQFHIIENAGHIPCVEQPEQAARLIARFLDAVAA
ncbi:3-oxoadipate enol-lactonase [Mesorhizobium sp. NBSH29]|uniref:3-oxoadipate enol-lactonase n=1 Tax=Mesorhizobium sp. NBSH29 TaxID=2654249 RepID=UPI0018967880|nr:3-oxoadipate enol-lactonase [Mesorhizobium sp. NBSH29]QPC86900.1 3-oxoadipate enol-lactonase [Mesorhizobium sp. NBSH29]